MSRPENRCSCYAHKFVYLLKKTTFQITIYTFTVPVLSVIAVPLDE